MALFHNFKECNLDLRQTFIASSSPGFHLTRRCSVYLFSVKNKQMTASRLPCRDFDASLYLCEEAFGLLPLDTLERLAGTLLLYPYVLTLLLLCGMLVAAALQNLR